MSQSSTLPRHIMSKRKDINREFPVYERCLSPVTHGRIRYLRSQPDQQPCNSINSSRCSLLSPPSRRPILNNNSITGASAAPMGYSLASRMLLSPRGFGTPSDYSSRKSLCSPSFLRPRGRTNSSISCRHGSCSSKSVDPDTTHCQEVNVNTVLGDTFKLMMSSFSGSELDTLSTCGQCGCTKLLDSPYLGWDISKQHLHNTDHDLELSEAPFMQPSSKRIDRGQGHSKVLDGSQATRMEKDFLRKRSKRQSSLDRFLCWKK